MKKTIIFSIILLGFTAMASQIILVREFLVIFYGNEMSIGYILAAWLIGGAAGSWGLGRLADKIKNKRNMFAFCQSLLGVLLPVCTLSVRAIKTVFGLLPGEMIAFLPMIISVFVVLIPICMLLGFMFAFSCRIYETSSVCGADKIGRVYILEAAGSMLGGILVSFFLIRIIRGLDIMAILGILNMIAALTMVMIGKKKFGLTILLTVIVICALIAGVKISGIWDRLHEKSLQFQWQGYRLLKSANSIYGNIAVTQRGNQRSFFHNGLHLYTTSDKQTAEESVHFALLEHPHPKTILLIGGGIGGAVEEILRHPIKIIDYLELDPDLLKMARAYLPREQYKYLEDSRVNIEHSDGRFFVKKTRTKYDCVIVNIGNPYSAQLNRYYTVEFFKEIRGILNESGIFSIALVSSENYINQELKCFLSSIYKSLSMVFADVKVIPGDTAYFLSCNKEKVLTYDYQILAERTRDRGIDIQYVRDYYLFNKLAEDKIQQFISVLKEDGDVKINYDFRPISYYYDMVFRSSHFRGSFSKKILKFVNEKRIWIALLMCSVIMAIIGAIKRKKQSFYKKAILMAVLTTGFAEMTVQMIILISFQAIYGYLFYKLGFIFTFFMIGLVLGGMHITKMMPMIKDDLKIFTRIQLSVCVYPLILLAVFSSLAKCSSGNISWISENIIVIFLPAVAGFIGGMQFPLANKIYLGSGENVGKVAGINYGIDLLGACLGALLTGTFLIPILGIPKTCFFVAIINTAVLIVLIINRIERH